MKPILMKNSHVGIFCQSAILFNNSIRKIQYKLHQILHIKKKIQTNLCIENGRKLGKLKPDGISLNEYRKR